MTDGVFARMRVHVTPNRYNKLVNDKEFNVRRKRMNAQANVQQAPAWRRRWMERQHRRGLAILGSVPPRWVDVGSFRRCDVWGWVDGMEPGAGRPDHDPYSL